MLTRGAELRDLPEGHTDFFREAADGCDGAVGLAGLRPLAGGGLHIAELTELVEQEAAEHICGNIQVIRQEVSEERCHTGALPPFIWFAYVCASPPVDSLLTLQATSGTTQARWNAEYRLHLLDISKGFKSSSKNAVGFQMLSWAADG